MIRRYIYTAVILLAFLIPSQTYADHIHYINIADETPDDGDLGVLLGKGESWSYTFDLEYDDMYLWTINSPTTLTHSTAPDINDINSETETGKYNSSDKLHYISLRIDPNNTKKSILKKIPGAVTDKSTSSYVSLMVNDIPIDDWSNRIDIYGWGVGRKSFYNDYGIGSDGTYTVKITLTGLDTLGDKCKIPITNVNLEGCFEKCTSVPEPATMLLFGLALTSLSICRRKLKK